MVITGCMMTFYKAAPTVFLAVDQSVFQRPCQLHQSKWRHSHINPEVVTVLWNGYHNGCRHSSIPEQSCCKEIASFVWKICAFCSGSFSQFHQHSMHENE